MSTLACDLVAPMRSLRIATSHEVLAAHSGSLQMRKDTPGAAPSNARTRRESKRIVALPAATVRDEQPDVEAVF